jgi:hypothetical protein
MKLFFCLVQSQTLSPVGYVPTINEIRSAAQVRVESAQCHLLCTKYLASSSEVGRMPYLVFRDSNDNNY